LNSSPRSTPEPSACENCRTTDAASAADAPETFSASAVASAVLAICSCDSPKLLAACARRPYSAATASKLAPVCAATR
jgi:hypothetical protein